MYLSDDQTIISLVGLRYVSKDDVLSPYYQDTYHLELAYKGQIKRLSYRNKEERDSIFDKIALHLRKPTDKP